MTYYINPWMRCRCGKLHVRAFVWPTSVCACGEPLYWQVWEKEEPRGDHTA